MKKIAKLMLVPAISLTCWHTVLAQNSRSEKKAANQAAIKKMVEGDNYIFEANYAQPQGSGQRLLTSSYDLRVTKDSVISFLPYFGRAYLAPPPGTTEGGITFTSTNFSYDQKVRKNGNWEINIRPRDRDITNWRDVQQMILNISPDGYASLEVISSNRDPISFQGDIMRKE